MLSKDTQSYEIAIGLLSRAIAAEILLMPRIKASSIDSRLYINRGDCYRALAQQSKAIEDYNQAIAQENVDLWEVCAFCPLV